MKRFALSLIVLLGCIGGPAGCRRSIRAIEAPEHQNPLMRRARACEQAGDLDQAIALYTDVLMKAPALASAHLQLALIHHDHTRDCIAAIYHYRRYLALRPGSDKETMVLGRIQKAEQLLATQSALRLSVNDPSGQVALLQQIDKLNAGLKLADTEKQRLNATNAVLTELVATLNGRIRRMELWIDRLQTAPDGDARGAGRRLAVQAQGAGAGATASRTYEVRTGDTLSRIADFVYGDPTLWPRIRDANREKVRDGERVRVGDILVIP